MLAKGESSLRTRFDSLSQFIEENPNDRKELIETWYRFKQLICNYHWD